MSRVPSDHQDASVSGGGSPGPPPDWLVAALAVEPATSTIEVAGCPIALERWPGSREVPPLVLVHGGAANAGWWRALAPALATDRTVVSMDLSGHGASGWRSSYTFDGWARELLAVAEETGEGPAVLCGHSMGGIVATVAAARSGSQVAGLILVDTPLAGPSQSGIVRAERTFSRPKRYPDEATARERFRLLPPQPVAHPDLLDLLVTRSLRRVEDGWTWRFDPEAFAVPPPGRPADLGGILAELRIPVWSLVGGDSVTVPPEDRSWLETRARAAATGGHHEIPGGHHHLMFDQSLALRAALLEALAEIRSTAPGELTTGAAHPGREHDGTHHADRR